MKNIISTFLLTIGAIFYVHGQGSDCASSVLLCDPNVTFSLSTAGSATVGTDCFGAGQPAPAFYTFAIGTGGPITMLLDTDPCLDVDYGLWGPFASPTGNCGSLDANRADCSFAGGCDNETFTITGIAGEFYILMVTNFSGLPVNVTLSQTGGTGALGGPLAFDAAAAGPFFDTDAAVMLGTNPPGTDPNVSITSFSGTGITNAATGMFDPSVAGIGTHTITVTGTSFTCPVTSTVDVVVTAAPVIANNDADGDGTPEIADPCSCTDPMNPDPATVMGPGGGQVFHEVVTVTSGAGETWEMDATTTGALDATGAPLALPAAMTEGPAGVYTLDFYHEATAGYSGDFSNGTATLSIANSCAPCTIVPTLNQWGLIILSLLLLNLAILFVYKKKKKMDLAY